jgi:hypothetical protein
MFGRQGKKGIWMLTLIALMLASVAPACGGAVSPTSEPTLTPTLAATPRPIGTLDTGMGGSLSVQGVVRDSSGDVASDVYVAITAYEGGVYWEPETGGSGDRLLGEWELYTDETGSYSFNNLTNVEEGHYQVWFNGGPEYGKTYENSGYYIINEQSGDVHVLSDADPRPDFRYTHDGSGDIYSLDVTVHPVTGSALVAVIDYKDADGATKNYFSKPLGPDHRIELNRVASPANPGYTIGDCFTSDGSEGYLNGLAGGTYYLIFQFIRSDGVATGHTSPAFEIGPGETKRFEYTIPLNP